MPHRTPSIAGDISTLEVEGISIDDDTVKEFILSFYMQLKVLQSDFFSGYPSTFKRISFHY
jgi:hypothetical protein